MTWVRSTGATPEIRALEENCWHQWRIFGLGPGGRLEDTDECLAYETPVAQVPYNAVLRFRPKGGGIDARIAALLEPYRRRNVPLAWLLHPSSQPENLGEFLGRQGLAEVDVIEGMTRSLADLPAIPSAPDGVEVFCGDQGTGDEWLSLVTWRYDLPASASDYLAEVYRHAVTPSVPGDSTTWWGARKDGRTLSKVVLHVGARVAGIYGVATRPEGQGQGLATLLMLTALHAARAQGLHLAVLPATPMAVRLYEKLGFRRAAPFGLWAEPGSVHV
jgi:ribosomal protein S18 acetylase RimI-like enzyme